MATRKLLLVESQHDQHVIKNLCKRHNIEAKIIQNDKELEPATAQEPFLFGIWAPKPPNSPDDDHGRYGLSQVFNALQAKVKNHDDDKRFECIGIMVDADASLRQRWQEIREKLEAVGYPRDALPHTPQATGTIARTAQWPTVGIWIMPDNVQSTGELENFISELIPPDDALQPYANTVTANLPEKRYKSEDHMKALIHTWLAWQNSPGRPMGAAISMGYLNHNAPMAQQLINWLKALFLN